MIQTTNPYTQMQIQAYREGTTNHPEHNSNLDYWHILLKDLQDKAEWKGKNALDFACGKGRNVVNMQSLCEWNTVDGVDLSKANIDFCTEHYASSRSKFFQNNGVDLQDLNSDYYDFVMSTIALQHIPVYDIRRSLLLEILRVLKSGGLFCFQMGFGKGLVDEIGRPRSSYYENIYNASRTNSEYDVRVQDETEVIEDLSSIGFVSINTTIRPSFSDIGHPEWIYIQAYKP